MSENLSNEIPFKIRNIQTQFRVAVFSFQRPFQEISDQNFSSADLILKPESITNVTWGSSVASTPQGGSFTILGGLRGDLQEGAGKTSNRLRSGIVSRLRQSADNMSMNLGSMFSDVQTLIKKMDYVAIFVKNVHTGLWYGSEQLEETSVPDDAKPVFLGIVTDISPAYSAAENVINYTVRFKNMLRLVEMTRYAVERSLYPLLSFRTGTDYGETTANSIVVANSLSSNTPPYQVIRESLKAEYPSSILDGRLEEDVKPAVARNTTSENFQPARTVKSSYESKLNAFRNWANNKDFELYAEENGQLVWKLPTYCRGVNKKVGNFITESEFNPDKMHEDLLYHLHDIISVQIQDSEAELINIVAGSGDAAIEGLLNDSAAASEFQTNMYYLEGGANLPESRQHELGYGFKDIGPRPMQFKNPLYYSSQGDLRLSQLKMYDFKVWKNNISKGITASVSMIDNPLIRVGMPVVIPMLANAGSGDLKGRVLPSIFYISALQRRYEYNKYPTLQLTLTHGRYIDDEFHNGIFINGKVSSWIKELEPTLVYVPPNVDGDLLNDGTLVENLLRMRSNIEEQVKKFIQSAKDKDYPEESS